MPYDVLGRTLQTKRVVVKRAEPNIASAAQKTADLACGVVVVDMRLRELGTVPHKRFPAEWAIRLSGDERFERFRGEPVPDEVLTSARAKSVRDRIALVEFALLGQIFRTVFVGH